MDKDLRRVGGRVTELERIALRLTALKIGEEIIASWARKERRCGSGKDCCEGETR